MRKKLLICSLIIALVLFAAGCDKNKEKQETIEEVSIEEEIPDAAETNFEVQMLDVGQGLAVLIRADDKYMLYDGGGRNTSSYVVSYLQNQGIDELEYIIASHYDEDHIFGLVGVLNTTKVKLALTPDYSTDTQVYSSFRSMLEKSETKENHPEIGDSFKLNGVTIDVLGPESYDAEDDNDKSIAVRISNQKYSVLIAGDSGLDAENDIVRNNKNIESTVYIVSHHGSSHSSGEAFLKKVNPQYSLISVGAENEYGHPSDDTLKRLNDIGSEIYRTDLNGELKITFDGDAVWVETEHEATEEENQSSNSMLGTKVSQDTNPNTRYVINSNTKKFHYPNCHSVDDMAEHNKEYSNLSRDELINQGYSPCGNCKP